MKKLKKIFKRVGLMCFSVVASVVSVASASEPTGTSLLNEEMTTLISQFGVDMQATVIALIGLLVPIGLAVWAISFGVRKGISFLQKRANRSIG